jgi:DNA-binding transcriptional MerR regulator
VGGALRRPEPGRTEEGHRRYTEADVETVLRLKAQLEQGYRIREAVLSAQNGNGAHPSGSARNGDGRLDLQDRSLVEKRIVSAAIRDPRTRPGDRRERLLGGEACRLGAEGGG